MAKKHYTCSFTANHSGEAVIEAESEEEAMKIFMDKWANESSFANEIQWVDETIEQLAVTDESPADTSDDTTIDNTTDGNQD